MEPQKHDNSGPEHSELIEKVFPGGFNVRDEANALTAHAFLNTKILEEIHAGKIELSDATMKSLMTEASERLAYALKLREADPAKYQRLIRQIGSVWCTNWDR